MKKVWRYLLVMLCLAGISVGSAIVGAKFGYEYARKKHRQRSNPEAWHVQAMRVLEDRLELAGDQREVIRSLVAKAVEELKSTRERTVEESGVVVDELFSAVDAELSPKQQVIFRELIKDRARLKREIIEEKPIGQAKSATPNSPVDLPAKKVDP